MFQQNKSVGDRKWLQITKVLRNLSKRKKAKVLKSAFTLKGIKEHFKRCSVCEVIFYGNVCMHRNMVECVL